MPPENMRGIMDIYEKSLNKDLKQAKRRDGIYTIKRKDKNKKLSAISKDLTAGLLPGKVKETADVMKMVNNKSQYYAVNMNFKIPKTERLSPNERSETSVSGVPNSSINIKVI